MEAKSLEEIEKFAQSEENSQIRAELWGDFVGWSGRRRGEGGFLINHLKQNSIQSVLDVALGDGVDAIFLERHGFLVSTNELDSAFREKAIENAKIQGVDLTPTSVDWRSLSDVYTGDSQDAILCMGNSLTCIEDREGRLEAVREFHKILKPGGVLLIDERNYQKILDNKKAVLAGTFHSTSNKVYTGTDKVKAKFLRLDENDMLIQYKHMNGKVAYYRVYPFKRGEMLDLLQEVGFSQITKFSDYEAGDNPGADFYQYVCVR